MAKHQYDFKKTILVAVLAVVVLALGAWAGIMYQAKKDAPNNKIIKVISSLSSKLVAAIAVYGQVTNINGANITLSSGSQSITLNVPENISVYSLSSANLQRIVPLSTIKIGEFLSVAVTMSPDGSLQTQSVNILPSTPGL